MDQLKMFPANADEALALLYLQNQDLSEKSPEELAEWYESVRIRIHVARTSGKKPQKVSY